MSLSLVYLLIIATGMGLLAAAVIVGVRLATRGQRGSQPPPPVPEDRRS